MTGDLMAALRESLAAAKRRPCCHPSADGDEGPVAELGRMPTRWRCHACGQVFEDPAGEAEVGP